MVNQLVTSGCKFNSCISQSRESGFLKVIGISIVLLSAGFVFNFVWEALHGVYLYQDHDVRASQYVPMLVYVSGMDALLILGLYGWIALLWLDPFWTRNPGVIRMLAFILSGIILAAAIEYRSVYVLNRWAYLPAMPTIFGIGISPLLQLAVTGCLSAASIRCMWHRKDLRQKNIDSSERNFK